MPIAFAKSWNKIPAAQRQSIADSVQPDSRAAVLVNATIATIGLTPGWDIVASSRIAPEALPSANPVFNHYAEASQQATIPTAIPTIAHAFPASPPTPFSILPTESGPSEASSPENCRDNHEETTSHAPPPTNPLAFHPQAQQLTQEELYPVLQNEGTTSDATGLSAIQLFPSQPEQLGAQAAPLAGPGLNAGGYQMHRPIMNYNMQQQYYPQHQLPVPVNDFHWQMQGYGMPQRMGNEPIAVRDQIHLNDQDFIPAQPLASSSHYQYPHVQQYSAMGGYQTQQQYSSHLQTGVVDNDNNFAQGFQGSRAGNPGYGL